MKKIPVKKVQNSSDAENLDQLVAKNVQVVNKIEQHSTANRTAGDRLADTIAAFCGSLWFVYVHVVWFGAWLLWNSLPFVSSGLKWDKPPFNVLTLVVSLEAIFLSTFILISQNRQQNSADQRNHLDLQIYMLADQERSQRLGMMRRLMEYVGVSMEDMQASGLEAPTDANRLAEHIQDTVGKMT